MKNTLHYQILEAPMQGIKSYVKIMKLKLSVLTWDEEFELLKGYSASNIQDYFEYFIKKMRHLPITYHFKSASTKLR